ncbi:MAG: M48 family metalloprotease [Acidimicrobiales bacterium]
MFKNTLKTFTLLAGLAGSFILVGSVLGGPTGIVIGAVLGFGLVGSSYWFSDRLAVRSARAEEVLPGQLDWLRSDLAVLAERAGMASPRLFLSPDAQPNAFATGRSERTAVVCVTEGLLAALDRDEVRGVVAHEVAHVRHRDILIGSIAAAVATGISMLANLAMFASMFGGGSDDDDAPNPLAVLVLALVAPVAASVMQMALSRSREFEADRLGAELVGDPRPLASALAKLERTARAVPMDIAPAQATAYIVNPLTGRNVKFSNLFLTHPPTEARIAALLADDSALASR